MYKYDVDELLNEIKGMSMREKNIYLQEQYDNLKEAISKIPDLIYRLNNDYEGFIKQRIVESIKTLASEKHWEGLIGFGDNSFLLKRNGSAQAMISLSSSRYSFSKKEKWWSVRVTVNKHDLINQSGDVFLSLPADESEILPTLKRIISAWCGEEGGYAGSATDEKDV